MGWPALARVSGWVAGVAGGRVTAAPTAVAVLASRVGVVRVLQQGAV